MICIACQEIQV